MMSAIGRALELKDEYTASHQHNVAELCLLIADRLGLDEETRLGLGIAASIHDIGKLGVPAEILAKPTKLSKLEFELIKTHSETGAAIFEEIRLPWPIADIIRQHHERMDGSGYPAGLKDHQILLEARIIAVADTYDAMTNNRPYRAGLPPSRALATITEGRGKLFDPYVVDAFFECLDEDGTLKPSPAVP